MSPFDGKLAVERVVIVPFAAFDGDRLGRRREVPRRSIVFRSGFDEGSVRGSPSGLMGLEPADVTNMAFLDWELFPLALECCR